MPMLFDITARTKDGYGYSFIIKSVMCFDCLFVKRVEEF